VFLACKATALSVLRFAKLASIPPFLASLDKPIESTLRPFSPTSFLDEWHVQDLATEVI